ncbi:MAG TPA: YhdP family protein, partial [Steroidobacteraceae bacterium]|nr:YhdP family protein [Steroidobacteraceae bacterium]
MSLRKVRKILLLSFAGLVILILTLMLGVKLTLDRAPQYQTQIKDWVFRQTGYHIAFTSVSPAFRWYGPELYFDRLELRSKDDRRVLARAAGGRIGADIWQLFNTGKLFGTRIELDSPDITIVRIAPDTFALASEIVLGGEQSTFPDTLTLHDLPAGTLAIRRGFVTIQDWNSVLPRLEMRNVKLDLRRGAGLISLNLTAQLPAVLGGSLSFNGAARGAGQLRSLDWDVLARTRDMSFPGWRELLPEYLTRLDAGTGAFEVVARGRGPVLERAALDFGAQGVVTNLTDGPTAKFAEISGTLTATHSGDRWTLLGRRLHAFTAGHRDPDSEFDVSWRGNDSGVLELRARASYLHAEALLPLMGLMPQKDLRDRLRDISPTGEWRDMQVQLARPTVSDPWQLETRAQFRGVGFAPVGRAPGLRGLSGMLAGNQSGGRVVIDTQTAVFNWPGQFSEPVNLSTLKTILYWKRTPEEFLVATPDIEMKSLDAAVRGKVAWHQPSDGSSPILTLVSTIDNGNVADAPRYLPRQQISPGGLAWLDRAFVGGHMTHADAIFAGPVRHFPFRDGSGVFLARCHIEGMTLDYREDWPRIEGVVARAEFRNEGMSARVTSGHAGGLIVDSADARFADFKNGELDIQIATHGDADEALKYLRATPLDALAENGFSAAEAKGPLTSNVHLFLPFKEFDRRRVQVHVNLDGATLNRTGSTLTATNLTGDADIDGGQVARADLRGRVLGGAFQMTAHSPRNRPVTRTQLDFHGTFSGDALHAALSLPANVPINGQTDWRGVLKMAPEPARERSLKISSSLAGLELKLPEPLAKPADDSLPASLEIQWPSSGGPQMRVALGTLIRGAVTIDSDANGPKLGRAAVNFGSADPALSDTQLVTVGGSIGTLDLTGWLKLSAPAKSSSSKPLSNYLHSAKFAVSRLDYLGLSFLDVTLDVTENQGAWRITAGGPNVVGAITLPGPADAAAPWELDFERLNFVDGPQEADASGAVDATGATADQPSAVDPRSIPAINFHAAELTWGDRQFGDVRATLAKLDDGISLKQLTVTGMGFDANAKGEWRGTDEGSGRVEGTIASTDVGDTLKQLGFDEVIQAKTGHLDFDMNWKGAPTADSLESAVGELKVALDKGQIVGIKPGAGRVLGLASLTELRRRLALDFSDLTDKGLAFDTVRGDFEIHDGSAHTDNLLVRGPAAEIGLIGRVGLKNKDYDQIAVVTGSLGSSPLPLAPL